MSEQIESVGKVCPIKQLQYGHHVVGFSMNEHDVPHASDNDPNLIFCPLDCPGERRIPATNKIARILGVTHVECGMSDSQTVES